jgi:Gas vesicle protein G
VGLLTGLLTLPLAPVRSVAWLAERILEQAEQQMYDPASIRRQLLEVGEARDSGLLSDEEATELENELLSRMMTRRSQGPEGDDGFPPSR